MSPTVTGSEIASRIVLATIAGALIGLNRGEHGRPAGLRTTLLVCLASSVAMIFSNLLLTVSGKGATSFVTIDPLRIPLGVLSGMGFIGGGVILKRGELVLGVTTAATLWYVTVIGLCFGAGQLLLGTSALILGLLVLWGLKYLENWLPRDQKATLALFLDSSGPEQSSIVQMIRAAGFRIVEFNVTYDRDTSIRGYDLELVWRSPPTHVLPPPILEELSRQAGITRFHWSPRGQVGLPD